MIDAAIVRVAKARRLISHNDLLAEVTQQIVHFKVQPAQVKKRIAALIEKVPTLFVCVPVCVFVCLWAWVHWCDDSKTDTTRHGGRTKR